MAGYTLSPVDYDPRQAQPTAPKYTLTPVDYDPREPQPTAPQVDQNGTPLDTGASYPQGAELDAAHAHMGELGRGVINKAANDGTFGFAPRIGAAVDALTGASPSYAAALESRNADQAQAEKTLGPIGSTLAGIAGAAPTMLLAAPAAAGVKVAGEVAPMLSRLVSGALSGAGYGAAQGLATSSDLSDPNVVATAVGGGIGGVAGAAGQALGMLGGHGAEAAANRSVVNNTGLPDAVANKMAALQGPSGIAQAKETLDRIGPLGAYLDTTPSMRGLAGGHATNIGEESNKLVRFLDQRDQGVNNRLLNLRDQTLGPDMSPIAQSEAIRAERAATTQSMYNNALDAPGGHVDATNAAAFIGENLQHTQGTDTGNVLQTAHELLFDPHPVSGEPVLTTNPRRISNVADQLNHLVDTTNRGTGVQPGSQAAGAAKTIISHINQALNEQVPGFAEADRLYGHFSDRLQAIEDGQRAMQGGPTAVRPDDFRAQYGGNTNGYGTDALVGARSSIEAGAGHAPNDLAVLSKSTGGNGTLSPDGLSGAPSYVEQHIGTMTNPDNAAALRRGISNEKEMRGHYAEIASKSNTARLAAGQAAAVPDPSFLTQYTNPNTTWAGIGTSIAAKGAKAASDLASAPNAAEFSQGLTQGLTRQGDAAHYLNQELGNLLADRAANKAAVAPASSLAGVFGALLGNNVGQRQVAPYLPQERSITVHR